jgi:hydroxyacylglutathione hydrolase
MRAGSGWEGATEIAIVLVPVLSNNYAWILHNGKFAAVVDPGDAEPVTRFVNRAGLTLTHVLVTHHHADHCAGAEELKNAHQCAVIGPDDIRIPYVNDAVRDGDKRSVLSERLEVIGTPGHTSTHVVYHFPSLRAMFTGDTLFCAGCGRMLEGTPAEMLLSLIRCMCVDDNTSVYCGHEYTEENLLFATTVEPENKEVWQRLADVKYMQRRGMPTVPSTIAVERATNPFLRTGSPGLRKKLGMESASGIEVFAELRRRKDSF